MRAVIRTLYTMKRLVAAAIHSTGRLLYRRRGRSAPPPGDVTRVLVMNFHYIGDVFFTATAIDGLKRQFPSAQIDALVKTRGRDALLGNPNLHEIIVFDPLCNDRTREPRTRWSALSALAKRLQGYDILIDCTGVPASCILTALARPRFSVGFSGSGFGFVFDEELWPAPDIPIIAKYHALIARVGAQSLDLRPKLHLTDEVASASTDLILHVGAGFSLKRWDIDRFRAVAGHFRSRGLKVMIVGGPADPAETTNLTIRQVAALALRCRAYLGLDTGLTHIVASLGVPTVAIYGPTNPRFSLQPMPNVRRVQLQLECSPAEHERQCAACRPMYCSHHSCMRQLSEERVIEEIEHCLEISSASRSN